MHLLTVLSVRSKYAKFKFLGIVTHKFSTAWRVSTHNPCVVHLYFLRLLASTCLKVKRCLYLSEATRDGKHLII